MVVNSYAAGSLQVLVKVWWVLLHDLQVELLILHRALLKESDGKQTLLYLLLTPHVNDYAYSYILKTFTIIFFAAVIIVFF